MNIIKLILIFLTSVSAFNVSADIYFGTLRGSNVIELKSPFSGVVEHNLVIDGQVNENIAPLSIKSIDLESRKEILNLKINTLNTKIYRLLNEYKSAQESYKAGFISSSELNEKNDVIDEAKISLQELKIELNALEKTLEMGSPVINKRFLVRQLYTVDKQIVNTGDLVASIETVDDFFIDFKFDPVSITGRIQDKEILIKSLVTGQTGNAVVFKVSNPVDNNNTQGSKIASLLIKADNIDLTQLLDTVFEIEIHDKN